MIGVLCMCSKHLGQHFLINPYVAKREIEYAMIEPDDIVLEVGPGKGFLTRLLAEKAKQVYAIELDEHLITYLDKVLPDNVRVIHADAVTFDFSKIERFTKVVSNLPFQISSPFTFKLLDLTFKRAVLIYQKEFALRMIASPGSPHYSRLSVGVYYRSRCKIREVIPPSCFHPRPLVDSAMVELIPHRTPPFIVKDEQFFFDVTRLLFNHRRKKIRTILSNYYSVDVSDMIHADSRVEMLSAEQIGEVSDLVLERLQRS